MRYLLVFLLSSLGVVTACGGPPSSDEDAGNRQSTIDAGTAPAADASSPAVDSGAGTVDSGSVADAGSLPVDAGSVAQDAGSPPVDAGSQVGLQPNICSIWESQIFSGCANGYCHGGGQAGGFRLDHSSAQALHESIVNVESAARMYYVVPENDRMSYLINKLDGTQDQLVQGAGDRMPPGGPYLSFDQIEVLRQWIAAGASNECP
jgi:hypothetical protein